MLAAAVIAFTITLVLTPVVIAALRRWDVLDLPNQRSFHDDPTPRGGGLAVAAGVVVAVGAATSELGGTVRAGFLFAAIGFGLIGLLDDVIGIPALRRLPILFAVAIGTLPWLMEGFSDPPAWRVLFGFGAVFWMVAYVNAYNFMDGINGIAVGQAAVAGLAWYMIGRDQGVEALAALGLIIASSALGFAPYNYPRARVFLGDVGSYLFGAVLAYAAVVGLRVQIPPEAVLAPLALYGADTAFTLVQRLLRGAHWYEAHREHVYQRLTSALGGSHTRATLIVVLFMAACSLLGSLSLAESLPVRVLGDAGIVLVLIAYLNTPRVFGRTRGEEPALAS